MIKKKKINSRRNELNAKKIADNFPGEKEEKEKTPSYIKPDLRLLESQLLRETIKIFCNTVNSRKRDSQT